MNENMHYLPIETSSQKAGLTRVLYIGPISSDSQCGTRDRGSEYEFTEPIADQAALVPAMHSVQIDQCVLSGNLMASAQWRLC